jgi:cellulose synthase (UDP-forming)
MAQHFAEGGQMRNWKVRAAGIFLLLATAWYLPWVFSSLNWEAPWLSIPFVAALLLAAVMMPITVINQWRYSIPREQPVPIGQEPLVVVVIPTYGEPAAMVYETAKSVLEQDYPEEKIALVISDDAHRGEMRSVVRRLSQEHSKSIVGYHEPPRRGDPGRRGEAKAGNLNSVLEVLNKYAPHVLFIETRDADDKVGDPGFLRQAVGQLLADPKVAFVQTIKKAVVSPGDPFGNLEPLFYQRLLLAKNAANAVFPCGSGLVWRFKALDEIGGFPTWNLVEDLQSGIEVLRRGWRGVYLPIVGAVGQTAPEDIPNTVKQRGTWAIDTMRLTFWGDKRGLSLLQYLHFAEMGLFYMLGFAIVIFTATPLFTLMFNTYPLTATPLGYAEHLWPYVVAIELLLVSLADGLPYEDLWRARQILLGMAPVYARATTIALIYGPKRKPSYRVTRKEHVYGWYWREVLPQILLFLALIAASLYHVATHSLLQTADLGSLFWAGFFILGLSQVVRNSWHGIGLRKAVTGAIEQSFKKSVLRRAFVKGGPAEQDVTRGME